VGERVVSLERTQRQVEPCVQGRGQGGQRAQGQVLAAAEDLADPPGGDAHPGREVGPAHAALAQVPVDLVGQLGDEGEHLLVYLALRGPVVWRNANLEAHRPPHIVNGQSCHART